MIPLYASQVYNTSLDDGGDTSMTALAFAIIIFCIFIGWVWRA